tara:strand:- start:210 stop:434 length:225 start_codon:yes stop_codon:yes gene_type:complete
MTKPSLKDQVFSFARSASKYVASGLDDVAKDVYEQRLQICNTCEDREGRRCGVCGCYLSMKAKWKTEECPNKKW